VAVLRGRLEDALAEYRTASSIAEERPLPHASMGGVLLRLGRADEALVCYDRALQRAPDYEVAVAGRAEALVAAGRNAEAADALERLAEIRLMGGRHEEAREALRRAVALHDTDVRRHHAERVDRLVEDGQPGQPGAVAGERERADGATWPAAWPLEGEDASAGAPAAAGGAADVLRLMVPAVQAGPSGEVEPRATGDLSGLMVSEEAPAQADLDTVDQEERVAVEAPAPAALLVEADHLAGGGDVEAAVQAYVRAADGFLARGAPDAAADACQRALDLAPGSADVHLALVRLYLATGSRDLAAEKLLLLGRLLDLGGSPEDRDRVAEAVREAFPGDPRFSPGGS
jgi:tetratricopeptide (TPR) repeat protein